MLPLDRRIHYLQGPLRFTWLPIYDTSEKWGSKGVKPHPRSLGKGLTKLGSERPQPCPTRIPTAQTQFHKQHP